MGGFYQHIPPQFRTMVFGLACEFYLSTVRPCRESWYSKQAGGGETKTSVKHIDNGGIYTFSVFIDDEPYEENNDEVKVSIKSDNNKECLVVFIDKKYRTATIQSLSYDQKCAKEGLSKPGGGTVLLRFSLNLLIQLQRKYKFDHILLKDNSFLICPGCDHQPSLANLKVILEGRTWYQKYGFVPYTASLKPKPSSNGTEAIYHNITIFKRL